MTGKLLKMLAVTGLGILLGISPGLAQVDLAKVLVGKWEGAVQWASGAGSGAGDPNRTLIIDSVEQKDGKWVAMGKYGVTGKGLGKVAIEVDDSGSRPLIRFATGGNSTVRLALSGTKELTGTMTLTGTSQRGNDRPMSLEKKE
jgi:hypothetical protein